MIVRMLTVGPLATNCYLVGCPKTREALVIDPGGDPLAILAEAGRLALHVRQIVNTHGHFDHTMANQDVKRATGATISIHALDASMLTNPLASFSFWAGNLRPGPSADCLLQDGDEISAGTVRLTVAHTPGHSPGSISLIARQAVFTGDALFQGSIGRTDLPGGDYGQLIQSIKARLLVLPDETVAYTGHGPQTTIGQERRYNPFLLE